MKSLLIWSGIIIVIVTVIAISLIIVHKSDSGKPDNGGSGSGGKPDSGGGKPDSGGGGKTDSGSSPSCYLQLPNELKYQYTRTRDQSYATAPYNGFCKLPTGMCIQYQGARGEARSRSTQDANIQCCSENRLEYTGKCCNNVLMPPKQSLDLSVHCAKMPDKPIIWDACRDDCYTQYNTMNCPKKPQNGVFDGSCGTCPPINCKTIDLGTGIYCIENKSEYIKAYQNDLLELASSDCKPNWLKIRAK